MFSKSKNPKASIISQKKPTSRSKATKPPNPRLTACSQKPDGETDSTTIVLDVESDDGNYVTEKEVEDEGEVSKSKAVKTGKAKKVQKKQNYKMPENIDCDQDSDVNVGSLKSDNDFDPIKNYYSKELVAGP
ncbi:hypothetical protein DFH28DRAFT_1118787 [Melampsora americana]|nr:hypothetical protein DFH28DRAFT_1118787 [Melampsora americana]